MIDLLVFQSDESGAQMGRALERSVFAETFGDTPELLAAEYAEYEDASLFLVAVDRERDEPAGVIRVIQPSPSGFKSLRDLERFTDQPVAELSDGRIDLGTTWDIATLAVAAPYRGRGSSGPVSLALYQGVCTYARRAGMTAWVAVMDAVPLRLVQWQLRKPFVPFDGVDAGPYLGSLCSLPVWSDLLTWQARLVADEPERFDLLFDAPLPFLVQA